MNTLVITNFSGRLTRSAYGDINSGFAKYDSSYGYDPFTKPGRLTWLERPSVIGATLDFPLTMAKVRIQNAPSSVVAVYGYGPDNRLVRYNVNASGGSPDVDTGSILTAGISGATPEIGGRMQFFGSTERIWIGHDGNVLRIDFDGANANPSVVGAASITSGVPRPSVQFLDNLYFANGTNLIEIGSAGTVLSSAKLSPGFPVGTFIRDLDLTPDGNYVQITVSRINAISVFQEIDVHAMGSTDSFVFYWNGTDATYTTFRSYAGLGLTSNTSFSDLNYLAGSDLSGTALYQNSKRILTLPNVRPPSSEAMFSIGNMVGFMAPEYVSDIGQLHASLFMYGQYDNETPQGLYRLLQVQSSTVSVSNQTDVLKTPVCLPVSNLFYKTNTASVSGTGKMYFSTSEWIDGGSSDRGFIYKFRAVPGVLMTSVVGGVWESQNQMFSKKVKVPEVRLYTEPLVGGNQFRIELIGSNNGSIAGGNQTFTVGTDSVVSGSDYVWYNPVIAPTHTLGFRITNLGVANWTGIKLEADVAEAGK